MKRKRFGKWCSRQLKAYHRVLAGMRRHRFKIARFMSLTSAVGMKRSMEECFALLNKRLYDVLPIRFVSEGYYSYETACDIYGEDNLFNTWTFNYMKICTSEGAIGEAADEFTKGITGVIHVIYFGIQMPQSWLSDQWYEITGAAYIVDLRKTYKKRDDNFRDIARYCIEQYTAGQGEFLSYFCSRNWIFPGAWKCYDELREKYKDYSQVIGFVYEYPVYQIDKNGLRGAWEACIDRGGLLPQTYQYDLGVDFERFKKQMELYREQPGMFGVV